MKNSQLIYLGGKQKVLFIHPLHKPYFTSPRLQLQQ